MVFLAQEPKSRSLLDLLYHSTSFAFHQPELSMEAKTSPLPVRSSWEEGSEGRRQGEFGGQEHVKEKGCWRTLGNHSRAWGDVGPFPAPILSEKEQQKSGRDGAFLHPSLVS